MLATTRHSSEFAVARKVLIPADNRDRLQHIYSPAHVRSLGLTQPACFAANRWLRANFEWVDVPYETSILSDGELPGGSAQNSKISLVVIHGHSVDCQSSGKHKGAGGRSSSKKQDGVVITKKGPDAWTVSVQCSALGAGSCIFKLRIYQDIYTHEGVQSKHYNHFRVVECSDLDKVKQWCKRAVSAAAAATAHAPILQQSAHVDNVHTDNIQALTALQQHSPLTASNLKRSRLESNASQSSDCPSISISQLAQQFRGLDVRVSQHDGRITQLHSQVQEHNDDLVDLLGQLSKPSARAPSKTASHSASAGEKCSSWLQFLDDALNCDLNNNHSEDYFERDLSFLPDMPSTHCAPSVATFTEANCRIYPGAGASTSMQSLPAVSAAQPTEAIAFNADLTKEQLQPIVLQTLQDIKPTSCSALELSKRIWPQQTTMRSCMKRMISGVLYGVLYSQAAAVSPLVIKNGTQWSHI